MQKRVEDRFWSEARKTEIAKKSPYFQFSCKKESRIFFLKLRKLFAKGKLRTLQKALKPKNLRTLKSLWVFSYILKRIHMLLVKTTSYKEKPGILLFIYFLFIYLFICHCDVLILCNLLIINIK